MEKKHLRLTPSFQANSALQGDRSIALDCELFFGPDGPLQLTGITHLTTEALTARVLSDLRPELVILPLFGPVHDAASAIERLQELGYQQRIAVLAPPLPRPALVERELRDLGPGERLVLITP